MITSDQNKAARGWDFILVFQNTNTSLFIIIKDCFPRWNLIPDSFFVCHVGGISYKLLTTKHRNCTHPTVL